MTAIRTEVRGSIGIITIDRPERRNALDNAAILELRRTMRAMDDDTSMSVVILSGGAGAFCSGADLKELTASPPEHADAWVRQVGNRIAMLQTWTMMRVPTIAAVDGPAVGIGFLLAIQSNLVIASERATFSVPEASLGFADPGTARHLRHWLSPQRVSELLFLGAVLDAPRAMDWSFVNEIHDAPMDRALALGEQLLGVPARSRSALKHAVGPQFLESDPATVGLSGAVSQSL